MDIFYPDYRLSDFQSSEQRTLVRQSLRLRMWRRITQEEYDGLETLITSLDKENWEIARLSMKTLKKTRKFYCKYKHT